MSEELVPAQLELNLAEELAKSEAIIEKGFETFLEVGRELLRIRDLKLYKANDAYSSFEQYCKERWCISRPYANFKIKAVEIANNLQLIDKAATIVAGSNPPSPEPAPIPLPTSEGQIRALSKLENPHEQREAWLLANEQAKENNSKPTHKHVADAVRTVKARKSKTAKETKPRSEVPSHLMRGIITPDMVGMGYTVCSDVNGDPCCLNPYVSDLEHHERVAFTIGGSNAQHDRKGYAKWERYAEKKIRDRVLKILELMSPLEVPAAHKAAGFTYLYDLNKAADLKELALMLNADLLRAAQTLELKEAYGHLTQTNP